MAKKKDVIERCNRYLNDSINMVESFEKLTEDLIFDITILDKKNAKSIVEEYSDYVMMLRSTYRDYRFNVENFERYVLRLNSVISSTLILEYRMHDILYNKDYIIKIIDEVIEKEADSLIKKTDIKLSQEELITKIEELTKAVKENAIKRTYTILNQDNIEEMKKDYYFIGNISKDKDLKDLIGQICQIYIENELIRTIRETIYKKHNIVIKNESKNKIHCLKMGAYTITSDKIKSVIELALQNYQENVIDNETRELFDIFLNFGEVVKEKQYKDIMNNITLEAVKKLEESKTKYYDFGDLVKDYTITILKELRWYISE